LGEREREPPSSPWEIEPTGPKNLVRRWDLQNMKGSLHSAQKAYEIEPGQKPYSPNQRPSHLPNGHAHLPNGQATCPMAMPTCPMAMPICPMAMFTCPMAMLPAQRPCHLPNDHVEHAQWPCRACPMGIETSPKGMPILYHPNVMRFLDTYSHNFECHLSSHLNDHKPAPNHHWWHLKFRPFINGSCWKKFENIF
jgi:hypothetical protein